METILVTGGNGLVGHAIKQIQNNYNYKFVFLSKSDGDLKDYKNTYHIFKIFKPSYVIHLAANVGGLYKNMKYKIEMLEDNLKINMNVLKCVMNSKLKNVYLFQHIFFCIWNINK